MGRLSGCGPNSRTGEAVLTFAEALRACKSGKVVTHAKFYSPRGLHWSDFKGGKFHTVDELGFKYQWWPLRVDREADWFVLSPDAPPV